MNQKLCNKRFMWCFHKAKLVLHVPCKRTKKLLKICCSMLNVYFKVLVTFVGWEGVVFDKICLMHGWYKGVPRPSCGGGGGEVATDFNY